MDVFDALARARASGQRVVLVTVLAVDGEASSSPGAKLVVGDDGVLAGGLGCSEFDAAGVDLAGEAVLGGGPLRVRRTFPPDEGDAVERALELFAEVHVPEPALLVLGSTPVARAVADLAHRVGRRVVLIAPGGDTAVAAGVEVRADDPVRALLAAPPGPSDAVVLSEHESPWVGEAVRVALASDAAYVGLLGSRRHAPAVIRGLREAGVPEASLAKLRTPVGLDLGARSPDEIGLSIVAEVLAADRGRAGGPLRVDWTA